MPNPRRYVAALALCLVPAILTSQGTAAAAPRVTWWPRLPLQGSLVRVVVGAPAGGGVTAVSGELAGEPLHFERFADGFGAIGAVPFGAEDSATARLVMEHADTTSDTVIVALPVARRRVPRERLRVSPEFAEPPDSLTERIRLEQELVQGVRQRAHETPRLWRVPFVRPRASGVTSGFGVARVFNKVLRSRHWGVDFAGQIGAPARPRRPWGGSRDRLFSLEPSARGARRHGRRRPADRAGWVFGACDAVTPALVRRLWGHHRRSARPPPAERTDATDPGIAPVTP